MSILDILSKSKKKKWLFKSTSPQDLAHEQCESISNRNTDKCHQLAHIEDLIIKASQTDDDSKKEQLLIIANGLKIELVLSYEKQGLYILAKFTQDKIADYKRKAFDKNK